MFMKKIVVIGGGVSGLIAAIHAKDKNNQYLWKKDFSYW